MILHKRIFQKAPSRAYSAKQSHDPCCACRTALPGGLQIDFRPLNASLLQGCTPQQPATPGASVWPPFNRSERPTGKSDVSSAANRSLQDSLGPRADLPRPHAQCCGSTPAAEPSPEPHCTSPRHAEPSPHAVRAADCVSVGTVLHLPLPRPVYAALAIT